MDVLLADPAELAVAVVDEAAARPAAQANQRVDDEVAQQQRGVVEVLVRAAGGLGNDRVQDAEIQAVSRGQPERLGDLLGALDVVVQDGGRSLGCDHRIDRVLLHEDRIRHAQRERAPAAALADHRGHDRNGQDGHRCEA